MPYSYEESKMSIYVPGQRSKDDVTIVSVHISSVNIYLPLLVNNWAVSLSSHLESYDIQ